MPPPTKPSLTYPEEAVPGAYVMPPPVAGETGPSLRYSFRIAPEEAVPSGCSVSVSYLGPRSDFNDDGSWWREITQ